MTRSEAVTILRNEQPHCGDKIAFSEEEKYEAFNMAIEALEHDKKEIINTKSVFNLSEDAERGDEQ